jgi:hypothetical protein
MAASRSVERSQDVRQGGLDVLAVEVDNSATSHLFIRPVASSGIMIAERGNDLGAAASANRAGAPTRPLTYHPNSARMCR